MDVSQEKKFLFITGPVKALSLLQGSGDDLSSQTTSCRLQIAERCLPEIQTGTENGAQLSCFYISAVGTWTRSTSILSPVKMSGQPGICPSAPFGFLS